MIVRGRACYGSALLTEIIPATYTRDNALLARVFQSRDYDPMLRFQTLFVSSRHRTRTPHPDLNILDDI